MATNQANGPMFCQAAWLPQSVADHASAPLANGRQNKVQIAQTGQELLQRPAEEIAKTSISVCLANERSDNTCHQFSLFSSNAWLLSQATQPSGWTNLLTSFWTWIALTGKMLGKSSSGKAVLCSNTFTYLFDTCYRIKMRVCVLVRLQIESPIRSEKDFTSANMFIKWNDSAINFWQKNIFFQILSF